MEGGTIGLRPRGTVVDPGKREEDEHRGTHRHDAPELGVDHQETDHQHDACGHGDRARDGVARAHEGQQREQHEKRNHPVEDEVLGRGPQDGIERGEIPDRGDMRRRDQLVGRDEVVVLEEVAAELRREEKNRGKAIKNTATPRMSCTV